MPKSKQKLLDTRVVQSLYITKTRWGIYELLNEKQYENKLIFG